MTLAAPRVSVVMRSRNNAAFVLRAMRSILHQTERDLELVVVDDASQDATPEMVAELARSDLRVRLDRQPQRGGAGPTLNRGVALARSGLVAIMDADDVAVPTRLARQVAFLEQHLDVGALGGALQVIREDGRPICCVRYPTGSADLTRMAVHSSPLATPTAMFRRSVFESVGGCRDIFATCAEDYDLWLRMAERTRLANLWDVLVEYRMHPAQHSRTGLEVQMLLEHWARASAVERRAGRPDPLDDPTLDLAELGRRRQLTALDRRELLAALAARANFFTQVGLPLTALDVLALAPQLPAAGPERAQVEIACARACLGARKLACVGRAALRAVRADPLTVARTGARALLKH